MMYFSIDEVTSEAMSITSNVTDADRLIARQWVASALSQMGMSEDEIAVCEITPKNLIAKKPDNCRKLYEIACYDASGNFIPHTFRAGNKRIYPNTDIQTITTNTDGTQTITYNSVDVSEDRFNIILGTNATSVAKIKIRYFAYPVDNEGMPMIREDEKQACVYYIRFCKAMKDDENQSKIQLAESMWLRACDIARAAKKASSLSNDKAKTIARTMNRMIPNFNRSQF